ncbi:zinc ribbon domain-containing protein [candidate division KSB1 bacterium]|nr:zinc ribbon domain-containing protein [candidate division KSB1 bacterium]
MENSTGKTIGLLILLLMFTALFMFVIPLFLHFFIGVGFPEIHLPNVMFNRGICGLPLPGFIALLSILIWVAAAAWVFADAEKRGMTGILWALLVFIGNFIGLLVYLIVRAGTEPVPGRSALVSNIACPECSKPVRNEFKVCPYCGAELKKHCPSCEKNVETAWKVCPYCGHELKTK